MANIIDTLRTHLPLLSRQEAAVASVILADPQATLQSPVALVANRAGVSQPTVIRLCRSVGCEGFADFKLKLAQSLVPGVPFVSAAVETGDGTATYVAKIFDATAKALHEARTGIDVVAVERAVNLLAYARRIIIFGVGGSAPLAMDAAHKFSRFAVPVQALVDPVQTRMILTGMTPGDVFVAISNTGRTRVVLDMAELAADNAVPVVAITAPSSPLAAMAAAAIGVSSMEDVEIFTPMASRIVQLTVIDVLTTGIALRLGSGAQDLLARIKTGLKATRIPSRD
jgi:RpiR family carbohydrate utilization transcriptional regulator